MSKFYTGIGSRNTPPEILEHMFALAGQFAREDWTLRSGAAEGADTAFSDGLQLADGTWLGPKEIYLPWAGFNGWRFAKQYDHFNRPAMAAYELAAAVHPAWNILKPGAKALHARNCHQVLGADLATPSRVVICWTPDGCESIAERTDRTGGTGTAISLASANGIPVFNLAKPGRLADLREWFCHSHAAGSSWALQANP